MRDRLHRPFYISHDDRGAQTVARDVTDRNENTPLVDRESIVPVSADEPIDRCSDVDPIKADPISLRKCFRQQRILKQRRSVALSSPSLVARSRSSRSDFTVLRASNRYSNSSTTIAASVSRMTSSDLANCRGLSSRIHKVPKLKPSGVRNGAAA